MKLGIFSKTALAVTLLTSQIITTGTPSNYYEDDNDFTSIANALTSGWGWGLNQAMACDDETDVSSPTECTNVEHIEVVGNYEETWSGYDPHSEGGRSEGYYEQTSGSSGGTSTSTTTTSVEQQQRQELLHECNMEGLRDKNECLTWAEGLYQVSLAGCGYVFLGNAVFGTACGIAASIAYVDQKGNCEEQYEEEKHYCQRLYG